ncbi:transglycosylase [Streptococcus sp. oral taxon 056 str. F0418]|uniref:penicillin-binding protein PBP1B n=1 Tax=Streptococcus sp. oral taxon 056 TaxID=712620 RepID=UPI000218165C|nr:penicillin-binding protein PBP1B [Streptococcus sp. oral taxon 056]EGP66540.1 transglycosylase [Streptococcus sp. oral taxon 056 str. F0418]
MLKQVNKKFRTLLSRISKKPHNTKEGEPLSPADVGAITLRSIKLLSNALFVFLFLGGLFGAGVATGYALNLFNKVTVPEKDALIRQVQNISAVSELTYADGSVISSIDSDLIRVTVDSSAISENVKKAVIATEDENFMTHNGVVPKAVLRATLGSVVGIGSASGGSTITQQIIKQQVVGDAPTFTRKATEIVDALALERYMTKDEILTTYLNVSPFGRNNKGQNIAGVEEAAQGIFGVSASQLTIPQAAFIAGLPQSPIVYSPYASNGSLKTPENMAYGLNRAKDVLYNMYRTGALSQDEYNLYKDYDLTKDFLPSGTVERVARGYLYYTVMSEAEKAMYNYLIKRDNVSQQDLKNTATVKSYKELAKKELSEGGYTITTTINKAVHDAMQNAVATYGEILDDGTGQVQVGNVLLNNQTGAVLGFIGGRNYAENQNNHAFDTERSPGSTIKPILAYGIAIDQGLMGSASILSNYPTNFSSGDPIMHADSRGTAMIDLPEALNASWNIPAYWTYKLLREKGVNVKGYMDKMGYSISDYTVESLPLGGGIEVSVAQHTNGFQTLANNGAYQERYMIEKITNRLGQVVYEHKAEPVQVYSPASATIMQSLMRGVLDSGTTTTFKSRLSQVNGDLLSADWIGKTGTTNVNGDMWLMLSTPKVTLGGWIGHDDNTSMAALTGYNNNASYMANLVNAIHQADPNVFGVGDRFNLDPSVIGSDVLKATGTKGGRVNVNGRDVTVTGPTVKSYWAKNGAPALSYRFAIGGTDGDLQQAWASMIGSQETEKKDKDKEKSNEKKNEKEEKDSNKNQEDSSRDKNSSQSRTN